MALAAGYFEYTENALASRSAPKLPTRSRWQSRSSGPVTQPHPWSMSAPAWSSGFHVVVAADENLDGRVTPEEVARLVRKADSDGDGSVNFHDIDRLIANRFRQARSRRSGPVAIGPNDRKRGDGSLGSGRGARSSKDEQPSSNLDE